MNSSNAFDVVHRQEHFVGVHEFQGGWKLKLFLITAHGIPFAPLDRAKEAVTLMLQSITERLSPEFEYGRFGFAVIHTGRRGVCVSIWHFGAWGTTFEFFSSVWYRYGYGFDHFELLNDIAPSFCWFEFNRTVAELRAVFELAERHALTDIRQRYFATSQDEEGMRGA